MAADAEAVLRASRRPLVIGMGGGGDVVADARLEGHGACGRHP
jgi:hypothetical protein